MTINRRPMICYPGSIPGYQPVAVCDQVLKSQCPANWMACFDDLIQAQLDCLDLCHNAHQLEWEGESYQGVRSSGKTSALEVS